MRLFSPGYFHRFLPGSNDCNLCGRKNLRFYSNPIYGLKGSCPHCQSFARHRSIWYFYQNHTTLFSSSKKLNVLHLGPEPCFRSHFEKANWNYITADLVEKDVSLRFDLADIPFKDNFLDAVIMNHVLEHIQEDERALRELVRVLSPSGVIYLSIPFNKHSEKTTHLLDGRPPSHPMEHIRDYGWDLLELFGRVGLQAVAIKVLSVVPPKEVERLQLKNDYIFVCTKASSAADFLKALPPETVWRGNKAPF